MHCRKIMHLLPDMSLFFKTRIENKHKIARNVFCWVGPLSLHCFLFSFWTDLPYARHYKPRFVFFFTQFSLQLRLILQTIYVLKTEILHFLSLKSAAYKRERLQIESGLWWRTYGNIKTRKLSILALKCTWPIRVPEHRVSTCDV